MCGAGVAAREFSVEMTANPYSSGLVSINGKISLPNHVGPERSLTANLLHFAEGVHHSEIGVRNQTPFVESQFVNFLDQRDPARSAAPGRAVAAGKKLICLTYWARRPICRLYIVSRLREALPSGGAISRAQ